MIRYVFRDGDPLVFKAADQADPQAIGEALEEIKTRTGGELRAKDVLDAARDKKHVLHKHFEWDDKVAADRYRLDQARSIIRVIRVWDEGDAEEPVRAFLSVAADKGTVYRSVEDVKSSRDLQIAVMNRANTDLDAFMRRYRELTDVCQFVHQAKGALQKRLKNIETRAAA